MSDFRRQVTILDDEFLKKPMPSRFNNEIFLSKTKVIHAHYECPFSIKYVYSGQDIYKINRQERKLDPGSVLITNNASEVELVGDSKHYNLGMSVFLGPEVMIEVFETLASKGEDVPQYREHIKAAAPMFYDDVIHHDADFAAYTTALYRRLSWNPTRELTDDFYYSIAQKLIGFQYKTFEKLNFLDQKKISSRKETLKRVAVAKSFIDDLGVSAFRLDDVARHACLSKFFLIRSFYKIYGCTPQQYYIFNKINHAKELLLKRHSVSEAAFLLNYASVQAFSRQFRQIAGFAPSRLKTE